MSVDDSNQLFEESVPQCSRLANVDGTLPESNSILKGVNVPGTWKSRFRGSTRLAYVRFRKIKGKERNRRGPVHTASVAEECGKDINPVFSFSTITVYIECPYAGLLNLQALMRDPMAN